MEGDIRQRSPVPHPQHQPSGSNSGSERSSSSAAAAAAMPSSSPAAWNSTGILRKDADGVHKKSLPIAVIVALWVALIANWTFALVYLSGSTISSSPGPVPKWQREQQQQQHEQNQSAESGAPEPPLIDSMWLYAALPALYMPTIVVFSYVNWLGWQFFKYN